MFSTGAVVMAVMLVLIPIVARLAGRPVPNALLLIGAAGGCLVLVVFFGPQFIPDLTDAATVLVSLVMAAGVGWLLWDARRQP